MATVSQTSDGIERCFILQKGYKSSITCRNDVCFKKDRIRIKIRNLILYTATPFSYELYLEKLCLASYEGHKKKIPFFFFQNIPSYDALNFMNL